MLGPRARAGKRVAAGARAQPGSTSESRRASRSSWSARRAPNGSPQRPANQAAASTRSWGRPPGAASAETCERRWAGGLVAPRARRGHLGREGVERVRDRVPGLLPGLAEGGVERDRRVAQLLESARDGGGDGCDEGGPGALGEPSGDRLRPGQQLLDGRVQGGEVLSGARVEHQRVRAQGHLRRGDPEHGVDAALACGR